MPISLPPEASHEHLKKQAKQLLKACQRDQKEAVKRLIMSHPKYLTGVSAPKAVRLQEAQVVVAREYGFSSWKQLLDSVADSAEQDDDSDTARILVLTNGTHTIRRMDKAGISGNKEEWLEILHEGPVPLTDTNLELNQIRARHFESIGWTSYEGAMSGFKRRERPLMDSSRYESLQLWFEHDLYDQLQLIQLLDFLANEPEWLGKIQLVQFNEFLGHVPLPVLAEGADRAVPVTSAQLELAQSVWSAFRQPEPFALADFLERDCSALPCLRAAIHRICQEFPGVVCGLSRTERQILECLAQGPSSLLDIFRYSQAAETAAYLGDAGFMLVLERLTKGPLPLIDLPPEEAFLLPSNLSHPNAKNAEALQLSKAGRAVLRGESDWLEDLSAAYWIGGCRIDGAFALRWNNTTETFVKGP